MINTQQLVHIKEEHGHVLSEFERQLIDSHIEANKALSQQISNMKAIQTALDAMDRGDFGTAIAAAFSLK
ncbi:hypothetical protein SEA_NANOSMITE_149 [Mycobacterium phage Nanosmite]|nr:hypothetical protein SEA_NANOSMITE_149 [Mycobacterium phage Nanosmite]